MKRIISFILSILTTTVLIKSSVYAFNTVGDEERVRDYIDTFSAETKCTAVSVAVVNGSETVIFGDGAGLYQIGSMTKAFTGLAVKKLICDGLLSEDDTVSEILPGFEAYYRNEPCDITITQLLTQTSGYTNNESAYPGASGDMSLMEWVYGISRKELAFSPGTEYAYSNVNYNLLGAVIGTVSGKSYEEYMETEILIPLGLTNTYVQASDDPVKIIQGSRLGYRYGFEYDIPVAPGRIPAGYFYSNAADMTRWLGIWLGTADIPEEYKEYVNTVKAELSEPGEYDYGWEMFESGTIGHSGGTPNYSSRIVFSEEEQIGVCVLTNMNVAASTDSLCNGIYSIYNGEEASALNTDVWTVFDRVFTSVTVMGLLLLMPVAAMKRRRSAFITGCTVLALLITVCVVMPMIFGAGLRDILLVWAPYSFAGGLLTMAADILAVTLKLLTMRKNENREKTSKR